METRLKGSARLPFRALFLAALILTPRPASAEWIQGGDMAQALARVMAAGRVLTEKPSYGWDSGVSLVGAFLRPKESIAYPRSLVAGDRYVFLGGGGRDVQTLDLFVLDPEGNQVACANQADAMPMVEFSPEKSGVYTIRVGLFGAGGPSCCALAVFRKGGCGLPMDSLAAAAAKMINACHRIGDKWGNARFHQEPNQWALFGVVMKEGESQTITGVATEDARHAFVALGDPNARNLDLFLLGKGGSPLQEDTGDDDLPMVFLPTRKDQTYGLRIRNTASSGPSLAIAAILDIGVGE